MTELSLTDNDLLTGNAAECWKCHHRWWSDDSINCPKCDTPTGELYTDTENPYFIIDLDTGVGYMGGIIAFPTKQLQHEYAETLLPSNVLLCEITRSFCINGEVKINTLKGKKTLC